MRRLYVSAGIMILAIPVLLWGCDSRFLGGAGIGAAGAGAAYEYQNKEQLERLEDDLNAGRITRDEYVRRKEEIESGSLIY